MLPGINPRDLQKAMQRMGIKQEKVNALEVIIRTNEKEIVISNPEVLKVNMMGQETWQIVGEAKEREIKSEPEILEEDIKTVIEQTKANRKEAIEALKKHKGNLAEAILELSS